MDELRNRRLCEHEVLLQALSAWEEDRTVFLPQAEIERRMRLLR